jgi:hypothetical protein
VIFRGRGDLARRLDWCPDLADHRDFSCSQRSVAAMLRKLQSRRGGTVDAVDWREFATPQPAPAATSSVEACAAMIEQCERRASGRLLQLSRRFLDHTSARVAGSPAAKRGLRTVLKAARRCGIPPEEHGPAGEVAEPPDAFAYCFQRPFAAIRYVRLDSPDGAGAETLRRVKAFVAAGFPVAFGFPVPNSMGVGPFIAYPTAIDAPLGGLAVTAVGFDDRLRIRSDKGALLVRNVLGSGWGDEGYGWLPYSYVRQALAADFWTLLKPAWVRSGEFDSPEL